MTCEGTLLQINFTREFLNDDEDGNPRSFVFTSSFLDNIQRANWLKRFTYFFGYNLCDVFTHEIGHFYGLGHHYDADGRLVQDDPNCNQLHGDGIMNPYYGANTASRGLSLDDKCMYAKRYFPTIVPVFSEQESSTVGLTDGEHITIPGWSRAVMYDVGGRCVWSVSNSSSRAQQYSMAGLSPGMYVLIVFNVAANYLRPTIVWRHP